MVFGFWLFSHVSLSTTQLDLSLWMIVLGVGIGLFMQVMTLAVQNSVDRADLGTASSATVFFRTLGSAFGTAIFGAVLTNYLDRNLTKLLPAGASAKRVSSSTLQAGTSQLHKLPPAILHDVLLAFVEAFHDVFLWGIPFAILAVIVALFLREAPLRTSTREMAKGESLSVRHGE